MKRFVRMISGLIFFSIFAAAQQSSPDSQPTSLAHQAIAGKASRAVNSAEPDAQGKSLGEMAREIQGRNLAKVRVSPEEAQKILGSVEPILKFASDDSGLTIHSKVRPRMISRDDLRGTVTARKVDDADAKRLQASELTLRKFGYVPRAFSTGKFVEGMFAELLAGFYDPRTKMISLLNWVSPDEQRDVLAHELTHALQDQNFNLINWQRAASPRGPLRGRFDVSEADARVDFAARSAVIEGQAMVVLIDHQFKEQGMDETLESVPGVSGIASQYMELVPVPDSPTIHASPIMLRDAMAFPYREGLVFELALLEKGGKEMAFKAPFQRPPIDTYEILHPDEYLSRQRFRVPHIPDLSGILAQKYEVVDSGGLGELDIRSLVKQYSTSRSAETLSNAWRGSAYLVVRRKDVPLEKATTADLALVYISAWDSAETAHQFAKFYGEAVPRRYSQATPLPDSCNGSDCLESFQFNTEEGFVSIQRRHKNLVFVTESFDPGTSNLLNNVILRAQADTKAAALRSPDLSLRYISSPIFSDLRTMCEQWAVLQLLRLAADKRR